MEVRKITNISGGVDEYMYSNKLLLLNTIRNLDSSDMREVSNLVSNLKFNIAEFTTQKIFYSMAHKEI